MFLHISFLSNNHSSIKDKTKEYILNHLDFKRFVSISGGKDSDVMYQIVLKSIRNNVLPDLLPTLILPAFLLKSQAGNPPPADTFTPPPEMGKTPPFVPEKP